MCTGFFLLSLSSYRFPAPAWVVCGLQSLWGTPKCVSHGPQSLSIASLLHQKCFFLRDHLQTSPLSTIMFPSTFLLPFLQRCLFTYLLTGSILCIHLCLLSCIFFLCHLPPGTATFPQTCLVRSIMCFSGWLKV